MLTPSKWSCRLNSIPYSLIALIARAATFSVFFRSGALKLADWSSTLMLFRDEYRVPVIPPDIAAHMAVTLELGCSSLILLGLLTRLSVALLLGMTLVIEIFVYPMAWPDHIQWLAFMFILLARGAGRLSLDGLIFKEPEAPMREGRGTGQTGDGYHRGSRSDAVFRPPTGA